MLRSVLTVTFVVGVVIGCMGQDERPVGESLRPILEVLDRAQLTGSLQFSGRCVEGYTPDLPQFRVPAENSGSPLEILREVIADHADMQVTKDTGGTIRIIERGVPSDVLDVTISHISFDTGPMYDPDDGVSAILHSPEVVAFMKARHIEWPFHGGAVPGNAWGKWPSDQPHLSGSLDNVMVREVLDRVLKTFPGIWVYENCPANGDKGRVLFLGFFHLQKRGDYR
jgi:hypothetical protein